MNRTSYLLPHFFQKIGWGLFLSSFLFLFGSLLAFNEWGVFPQSSSHYATLMLRLILYSSAFLVAFSKEKREDEMIQYIRASSVVITAYAGFLVYLLAYVLDALNQSFHFYTGPLTADLLIVNPVSLFMLYVVIFRVRIFMLKRKAIHEE